jgi:hypothetical protein
MFELIGLLVWFFAFGIESVAGMQKVKFLQVMKKSSENK